MVEVFVQKNQLEELSSRAVWGRLDNEDWGMFWIFVFARSPKSDLQSGILLKLG